MKKCLSLTAIMLMASLIICSLSSAAALNRIGVGNDYTMAIKSSGTLFGWGLNDRGQLGDGTVISKSTPTQETTAASNWAIVAASIPFNSATLNHTAAVRADGTLWAWGDNSSGQVGDSTSGNQRSAATQENLHATNWTAVAAGDGHTVAVRSDGTLWAWGRNNAGQLGDGTFTIRTVPTQIGSATTWIAVAAGGDHTLALRSDGTLWAWGDNNFGQVGDGTSGNQRLSPVQIGTDTTWTAVAAGANHSVALRSNGTVWTWGLGTSGQLGHGNTANRLSPMQVAFAPANEWASIAAGSEHTVAIRSDGTLWAWGNNSSGQIGDNTGVNRTLPTQENTGATTWAQAAAGLRHTIAVKTDGTLWAWGDNTDGELGDGTAAPKFVPTSITLGYTISPFVISTTPANRATHVAVGTRTFTAVFDRAMKASTINSSTFTIGGVSGTVSFNAATRTATFTSSSNLAFSTTYTATITTAATDASDIPLGMNFTWTFTTIPEDDGGGGGGGCFIATAAFGSYLHPHVQVLRGFRDRYLVTNRPGRLFVDRYYRYSPSIASIIEKNAVLKTTARWILTPVVYAVKYPFLFVFAFVVGVAGCAGLRARSFRRCNRMRRGGP